MTVLEPTPGIAPQGLKEPPRPIVSPSKVPLPGANNTEAVPLNTIATQQAQQYLETHEAKLGPLRSDTQIKNEAYSNLPPGVKAALQQLLTKRDQERARLDAERAQLNEARLKIAAPVHAKHFLDGHKAAFGFYPSEGALRSGRITNEAWSTLSPWAQREVYELIKAQQKK